MQWFEKKKNHLADKKLPKVFDSSFFINTTGSIKYHLLN